MKKIKLLIVLLLFITISMFSQNDQTKLITKLSYSSKSVGVDFGYISDKSIYQCLSISLPVDDRLPDYFNYGIGYVFDSNFYIMGLAGMCATPQNDIKLVSNKQLFSGGAEIGYIYENTLITSVFYTNSTGIGIKFGFIL